MNFGMITLNQSTKTKQNYAFWIHTSFLFILNLKLFMKTLLVMLKNGLTHETAVKMIKGRFQLAKARKKWIFSKMN